jgi:purine-binding chemotaxis protein CheW
VVDGVSDVLDVDPAQVRAAPDLGSSAATPHILGLLPLVDRMLILLDIDKLIGHDLMDSNAAA